MRRADDGPGGISNVPHRGPGTHVSVLPIAAPGTRKNGFLEIFPDLVLRFRHRIANAKPLGDEAILLAPKIGEGRDLLISDLEEYLAPLAWLVTSRIESIIIEPIETDTAPSRPFFFHVCLKRDLDSIRREGLLPKSGGTTAFHRRYPPRLHLARTLSFAFQFIEFQTGILPGAARLSKFRPILLRDITVLRVRHDGRRECFVDPLFASGGIYVKERVPPSDISVVAFWRRRKWLFDLGVRKGWW